MSVNALYQLLLTAEERKAIAKALKEEYNVDMSEIAYICLYEAEGELIIISNEE